MAEITTVAEANQVISEWLAEMKHVREHGTDSERIDFVRKNKPVFEKIMAIKLKGEK